MHLPPELLTLLPPGTRLRVHPRPDGTVLLSPASAAASYPTASGRVAVASQTELLSTVEETEPGDDAAFVIVPDYREVR